MHTMRPVYHKIWITSFVLIWLIATILVGLRGASYYNTDLALRYYHPDYSLLKPSGFWGHGLGIIGTLCLLIGIFSYMARKRVKFLSRVGKLKHWLEFHIFLCSIGPVLVLFHTTFKFGGLVAISFWSMVLVVLSGIIGRFIYLQIPRSIEGRELSLNEVMNLRDNMICQLKENYGLGEILENRVDYKNFGLTIKKIKADLKKRELPSEQIKNAIKVYKAERKLNGRIASLIKMQNLFRYWHVVHLPFALIMLIILAVHVIVALLFGYKWVF